jgi:hypothetical protein
VRQRHGVVDAAAIVAGPPCLRPRIAGERRADGFIDGRGDHRLRLRGCRGAIGGARA